VSRPPKKLWPTPATRHIRGQLQRLKRFVEMVRDHRQAIGLDKNEVTALEVLVGGSLGALHLIKEGDLGERSALESNTSSLVIYCEAISAMVGDFALGEGARHTQAQRAAERIGNGAAAIRVQVHVALGYRDAATGGGRRQS